MDIQSFKYQFRNYAIAKDCKILLLGIRGYLRNGENLNSFNIYDDAIVRCIDGDVKIFPASVDPGKYYINHPINPHGCAKLKSGLYSYAMGEHHAMKALVQANEVTVDRLDSGGKKVSEESGWFGINIHSGGPEYLVGRYSAGCQVIKTTEAWKAQWLDFFSPMSNLRTKTYSLLARRVA
jgi:hypothetical protein